MIFPRDWRINKETHTSGQFNWSTAYPKNLLKNDIVSYHLLNTYSVQDALYMLSPLHTVKIEAWKLVKIFKVTQLANGETESWIWFTSKACTMLPLAVKLLLLLCKISKCYFLYLKAPMLFFFSFLKRTYLEKKLIHKYSKENKYNISSTDIKIHTLVLSWLSIPLFSMSFQSWPKNWVWDIRIVQLLPQPFQCAHELQR